MSPSSLRRPSVTALLLALAALAFSACRTTAPQPTTGTPPAQSAARPEPGTPWPPSTR